MMADFIESVISLGGNVVPVINLAAKFGLKKTSMDIAAMTSLVLIDVG